MNASVFEGQNEIAPYLQAADKNNVEKPYQWRSPSRMQMLVSKMMVSKMSKCNECLFVTTRGRNYSSLITQPQIVISVGPTSNPLTWFGKKQKHKTLRSELQ